MISIVQIALGLRMTKVARVSILSHDMLEHLDSLGDPIVSISVTKDMFTNQNLTLQFTTLFVKQIQDSCVTFAKFGSAFKS